MNREQIVLAAMAATPGTMLSPVQAQKLLFLIDVRVGDQIGGKQFDFKPYDYGPFDRHVYVTLEDLARTGRVEIFQNMGPGSRTFALTEEGRRQGEAVLSQLPTHIAAWIGDAAKWVVGLNFAQLVSAIYREFPEMKANSVFSG